MTGLALASLILALLPLALGLANLLALARPRASAGQVDALSVLIPARGDASAAARAISSVLASRVVTLECLVHVPAGREETAAMVREIAAWDDRVRLVRGGVVPQGWRRRNHACHLLSERARHALLVFMDPEVVLSPDALAALAAFMARSPAGLVVGLPRVPTRSVCESLLAPLVPFLLHGFVPAFGVRHGAFPLLGPVSGTGCCGVVVARAEAYASAGGHAVIRGWRHEGFPLARAFRRAGFVADLLDLHSLATSRPFGSCAELRRGLSAPGAGTATGSPALPVWTLLVGGGSVIPPALLAWCLLGGGDGPVAALAALGTAATLGTRALFAWRFEQDWRGVPLHPLAMAWLIAAQWRSFVAAARKPAAPWDRHTCGLGS